MRLKRENAEQFVGYLADPILHVNGLAAMLSFHAPRINWKKLYKASSVWMQVLHSEFD